MPDVGKLTRRTQTLVIGDPSDPLRVTYNRGGFSVNLLTEMAEVTAKPVNEQIDLMARVLARLIVEWNLTSEKKPIPITHAALRDLDLGILELIFEAINAESSPDPQKGEPLAAGS